MPAIRLYRGTTKKGMPVIIITHAVPASIGADQRDQALVAGVALLSCVIRVLALPGLKRAPNIALARLVEY
jgi:hypothetical protein